MSQVTQFFGQYLAQLVELFAFALAHLYLVTGNLGIALIVMTLIIRFVLLPLTLPSLKAQHKMRELQPDLKKLKNKHGSDRQAYQAAQLELYRKHNVNPLAGCLPQLAQLAVLIFLYHALVRFFSSTTVAGIAINPSFFWLDLTHGDPYHVVPVLAGVTQFVLSIMILPATETPDAVDNNSTSPVVKAENEKEDDMAEMAASMQQQMVYMLPVMTVFFAWNFPAGLGVYWIVTTVFSIAQQWALSGPGGLATYPTRVLAQFSAVKNRFSPSTSTTAQPTPSKVVAQAAIIKKPTASKSSPKKVIKKSSSKKRRN